MRKNRAMPFRVAAFVRILYREMRPARSTHAPNFPGASMKENTPIVEYGMPIDARVMIEPPDAAELELEAGHPGLGDEGYVKRRKELFALCRRHRLNRLGPPLIDYTPEETRIWRDVSPKLDELHRKHACQIYLKAKDTLGISAMEIPQLRNLSDRVKRETNMHLVPA